MLASGGKLAAAAEKLLSPGLADVALSPAGLATLVDTCGSLGGEHNRLAEVLEKGLARAEARGDAVGV